MVEQDPDGATRHTGVSASLPVASLREAAPFLRRPFTPEAIRFKVQTVFRGNSGCLVVAYIDARLVIERLNAVCPDLWFAEYVPAGDGKHMVCKLTVDGVTRQDVGHSPKGMSKDLFSDAFKRAAVHFGVGVSVYALPQIRLLMADAKGRIELRGRGEKETIALTEHGHVKLREGYAKWLDEHGRKLFDEPLDHGDVEGAVVDEELEAGEEFVPEPAAPVEDEAGVALIARCRAVYDEIRALPEGAKKLPPETFNGWLTGAQHSHVELEKLVGYLESRRDAMGGAS